MPRSTFEVLHAEIEHAPERLMFNLNSMLGQALLSKQSYEHNCDGNREIEAYGTVLIVFHIWLKRLKCTTHGLGSLAMCWTLRGGFIAYVPCILPYRKGQGVATRCRRTSQGSAAYLLVVFVTPWYSTNQYPTILRFPVKWRSIEASTLITPNKFMVFDHTKAATAKSSETGRKMRSWGLTKDMHSRVQSTFAGNLLDRSCATRHRRACTNEVDVSETLGAERVPVRG